MIPSSIMRQKFLDANGKPLAGGKLYSYAAGTSTPLGTYADSGGTPNSNPIILNAAGEANVWLDPAASYKFVLNDLNDVTQWTVDNFSGLIADGIVNTAKLATGAVTTAKLALNSVDSTILKSDPVTDAVRAVTTNSIRDGAITAAKLNSAAVDGLTIENTGTAIRVKDGGIVTAKIADFSVTQTKRVSLPMQTSGSSGVWNSGIGSNSFVDVPNLSATLTTTGRPVFVCIVNDGLGVASYVGNSNNNEIRFTRDGTEIGRYITNVSGSSVSVVEIPGTPFQIDVPPAGTHTYKLQAISYSSGVVNNVNHYMLYAFEL